MPEQAVNVLLVEDDQGMEKIISRWLQSVPEMRFNVIWADTLRGALEALSTRQVHLILLDLNLPDSSSLDTLTRTCNAAPALPIIVLTANDEAETGINAVKMGAQDYLTKGAVNLQRLKSSIMFSMERKKIELEILSRKERLKEEYEVMSRATKRLISPEVVNQLLEGKMDSALKSEQRFITVMFADVRGFTAFAEYHPAGEVARVLNHLLGEMAVSVIEEGGYLDKFLGDGLMAIFGAPNSLYNQWLRAARAAFKMQARMDLFNRQRLNSGPAPEGMENDIQIGIGINSGNAIVGFIGTQDRCEYTAIGDSVNIASRICAGAEGGEILITRVVWDGIQQQGEIGDWRLIRLKGKKLPIEIANLKYVRL